MPPHDPPHNNLILIVDDHAPLRQSIKGILAELGYQAVEQASNGREAISILQQQTVACIV
ncbi:MAG: response regulator, partial [Chitinimonas sp.]|nr:response regulator [Chitinimonas sp.]